MRRFIEGTVPILYLKEGDMFVAHCPVLDLSTCGETFQEAEDNVREALELFFDECVKRGTLDRALTSLGWKKARTRPPRWQPPVVVGEERLPVRVPVAA